jgi:hypothetical protein
MPSSWPMRQDAGWDEMLRSHQAVQRALQERGDWKALLVESLRLDLDILRHAFPRWVARVLMANVFLSDRAVAPQNLSRISPVPDKMRGAVPREASQANSGVALNDREARHLQRAEPLLDAVVERDLFISLQMIMRVGPSRRAQPFYQPAPGAVAARSALRQEPANINLADQAMSERSAG